jgi:thiol:disulfide interchange protein DsbD
LVRFSDLQLYGLGRITIVRCGVQAVLAASLVLASVAVAAAAGLPRPANEVFQVSAARTDAGGVRLHWTIAEGTYLYRNSIAVTRPDGAVLPLVLPAAEAKDDPFVGKTKIYRSAVELTLAPKQIAGAATLRIAYQGCAESVFCYAPLTRTLNLDDLTIVGEHGGTP